MARDHHFQTDAAIIARLGRQLVARQETALIELVKNAYDADATQVVVSFSDRGTPAATIQIEDDGTGMTYDEIVGGFLRLASETKVEFPKSPRYRRTRAGRKGIGRFSTQRLGDRLELTTYAAGEPQTLRLVVDWTSFEGGKKLEDVRVEIFELPPQSPGTRLQISGLHDSWAPGQIDVGKVALEDHWRIDTQAQRDPNKPPREAHPLFHYQRGGHAQDRFAGEPGFVPGPTLQATQDELRGLMQYPGPRVAVPPVCPTSALDLVISQHDGPLWRRLMGVPEYANVVERCQDRIWQLYVIALADTRRRRALLRAC